MDPERQPLLVEVRCRRYRPLTYEEVIAVRTNSIWRRSRLILALIFWATMAMFLSIIACLLLNSSCRVEMSAAPGVPPVHLTLAPIMASSQRYNGPATTLV